MHEKLIAGVDEVGRGPLIGDVVTAAVILDPSKPILNLNDSKKLSEKKRIILASEIKERALCWAIGRASPEEIDQLNILHATLLAMQRAVYALPIEPQHVLIDGNRCPELSMSSEAIIQGDAHVDCISAASIIAKVTRDQDMVELDKLYPDYGFAKHKGYPTALHRQKIEEYGVLDLHRKSFKPIQRILEASI